MAINQPHSHFGEWFTAIYYKKLGYKSLIEKYYCKSHKRKMEIISRYLSVDLLRSLRKKFKAQPPDLFVYKGKKFFFAEVKVDNDIISETQKRLFAEIERKLRCEIIICKLK